MLVNFKDCLIRDNKVYLKNKIAVLISGGFGAGWYSWNTNLSDCLTNPKLVELVLEKEMLEDELGKLNWSLRDKSETKKKINLSIKNIEDIAESLYGNNFYSGGAKGLYIEWVEKDSQFRIEEYDGSESLVYKDSDGWLSV
jgi:hypothetical protein